MHIQANGISIHYQIEGPEDSPIVVLSHSLAAHLGMWDAQMSTLLPQFRVLRYEEEWEDRGTAALIAQKVP